MLVVTTANELFDQLSVEVNAGKGPFRNQCGSTRKEPSKRFYPLAQKFLS